MDFTASMVQSFEVYKVDPITWHDIRKIDNVTSCSITRDGSTDLLENASISCNDVLGEIYIRIYLVCVQNDITEKIPLGTFLVQTPSTTFDGKITSTTLDAYSPLLELKDKLPAVGKTVKRNANILQEVKKIISDSGRAPVIETTSDMVIDTNYTTTGQETTLDFIKGLIKYADHKIGLDELSRIIFVPDQNPTAMQQRWTFTDDNSSILNADVSVARDLYGVPNVVEVIYADGDRNYYARAVNDNPNSEISTVSRGREVQKRITNPAISGVITQAKINEYARKTLEELSTLVYTVTYSHGYCPVRVGDCVKLNYKAAGLNGIKAVVTSQNITCATGVIVNETATFSIKLWEG